MSATTIAAFCLTNRPKFEATVQRGGYSSSIQSGTIGIPPAAAPSLPPRTPN